MAGKAKLVDRSKVVTISAKCADGEEVEVMVAGDGTLMGTILNADALDKKILGRIIGDRQVVSLSVVTPDAPATTKKR